MDNEKIELTVSELIEQLQQYPQDALVVIAIGNNEAEVSGFSSDGERVAITGDA